MAVTAGMLAKAAATALSNEKLRKGIISPFNKE